MTQPNQPNQLNQADKQINEKPAEVVLDLDSDEPLKPAGPACTDEVCEVCQ